MAPNTAPIFGKTAQLGATLVNAANTALDGSGTLVQIAAGGANGSRIDEIVAKAAETTTAGMIRIFHDDGSTKRLYDEIIVDAVTPSATVQSWRGAVALGMFLPSGHKLWASTHNAEDFNVFAKGSDY